MKSVKQNKLYYRIAQVISRFISRFIFKRRILRNEIKGKKGPYLIIANHECALDYLNLIGASITPMTCVISNSFFNTLPIKGFLRKMGVIPKQQFQTHLDDIKKMKSVINAGRVLVIYPAGLMTENGLSTPIPDATYRFLQWLKTDVYVARTTGSYFVMPKWGKGLRPGRTHLDIYKLFSCEELAGMEIGDIRKKADEAMLFDAYREQEEMQVRYRHGDRIEGLENVLYMCPHCRREMTMRVRDEHTIYCTECGYAETSDEYGFLHLDGEAGEEIRYVSDWSRMIYADLRERILAGTDGEISTVGRIAMIDEKKKKYADVGEGSVSLSKDGFHFVGRIHGNEVDTVIPITAFASLPFSPGKHFEIQHGDDIFRCYPEDGRIVMKIINIVKIYYELSIEALHEQQEKAEG